MKNPPVRYSIFPSSPEAHLFEVRCTVDNPDPWGQKFSLPTWIPGSYLIQIGRASCRERVYSSV